MSNESFGIDRVYQCTNCTTYSLSDLGYDMYNFTCLGIISAVTIIGNSLIIQAMVKNKWVLWLSVKMIISLVSINLWSWWLKVRPGTTFYLCLINFSANEKNRYICNFSLLRQDVRGQGKGLGNSSLIKSHRKVRQFCNGSRNFSNSCRSHGKVRELYIFHLDC